MSLAIAGSVCGDNLDGTHTSHGCAWSFSNTKIPGEPTNVDPDLLTTAQSIANPMKYHLVSPWRAPGQAPVESPCGCYTGKGIQGCVYGGDGSLSDPGADGLDLQPNPNSTVWQRGAVVQVASSLWKNHGGGWSFRLCPKGPKESMTEACFAMGALQFVEDIAVVQYVDGTNVTIPVRHTEDQLWTRVPVPGGLRSSERTEFEYPPQLGPAVGKQKLTNDWDFSIIERVRIPDTLAEGEYLLSWRWDCESSTQIWLNCADVTITKDGSVAVQV